MDKSMWTLLFYYGNVIIVIIAFVILIDRKKLGKLIPIGLFIAAENYTVETIGLHLGYWEYPLKNPGYPEIVVISSLIYFPFIAMLFYQYISKNRMKNIILIACFLAYNMIIEIISLKTTSIFIYHRGTNLLTAFLMYLGAYIVIILFGNYYNRLCRRNL